MNPDIVSRDLEHLWHPYTQMKDCEKLPPIPIHRAEGIKLYGAGEDFYYDTISSWWCNVHGHNHPRIKAAIKEQLDRLEHVLFAGFTHAPAVELAESLVSITPPGLTRVFFSDDGSTAVEVALKMSLQYWHNRGETDRTKFLSLEKAYHGDTVGAMSVSGVDTFNEKFKPLFFDSLKAGAPYCYRCPEGLSPETCSIECLGKVERILRDNGREIAAMILEPLLMGAGGMIIYPAAFLEGVRELTREYNVHLILDEVATGFGRTGKMFACEHVRGLSPEFMCLSKGITSGYLPLGATLTTEEVFKSFYDGSDRSKTFFHGHTYTANPLACAAGVASLKVFRDEGSLENVKMISSLLRDFLSDVSRMDVIGDTRQIGAVAAMELVEEKRSARPFPPSRKIGEEIYKTGLDNHILLRPLGDVIYFFLPLCTKEHELEEIFSLTKRTLKSVFG